jgi:hypothetical protein
MQQFSKSIKERHPEVSKLELFDFTDIRLALEKDREERKNKSEEEKAKIKLEKDEQLKFYGSAIVDGTYLGIQALLRR